MQADAMRQQAEAMAAAQAAQAEAMAAAQAAQAATASAAAGSTPSASGAPASPAPTASSGDDRIAQLERIAGLRDRGVLTEDEFQAEKRRILGG
jgi:hypothetical protein